MIQGMWDFCNLGVTSIFVADGLACETRRHYFSSSLFLHSREWCIRIDSAVYLETVDEHSITGRAAFERCHDVELLWFVVGCAMQCTLRIQGMCIVQWLWFILYRRHVLDFYGYCWVFVRSNLFFVLVEGEWMVDEMSTGLVKDMISMSSS